MEKYPMVRVIHGSRNTQDTDKVSSVEIEISFNRKRKWLSTGIRVSKKNWSDTKHVFGLANAVDINMSIDHQEKSIKSFINKLMVDGRPFTWSALDVFLESANGYASFIDFVADRVANRNDIKETTRRNHRKFLVALKEYGKIVSFNDLSKSAILRYDAWLKGRKAYKQSTIASYHKYMKVYVNDAIRMELLLRNPYDGVKISQGKSEKRRYLTMDDLNKVETAEMINESISRVRDLFIFQCYTGLAYSDMKTFDFNKVERKGSKYVLYDSRHKTESDYYIVLLPKAIEVLQKYNFKLPVISLEQYNLRLKIVALCAGLNKPLTSHMGRHTYATMCINMGIKIEVLADMLGHKDIRTTQIYAHIVNKTVEESYDILNEKLKQVGDSVSNK